MSSVTALTDAIRPVFSIAAVAFGLGRGVGQVFVLACAMPAAVTPLLLTVEYDPGGEGVIRSEYVSTAILLSTIEVPPRWRCFCSRCTRECRFEGQSP